MPNAQTTKDTQVYQSIRRHIMGHVYRPGEHLREEELCREFNVTRTPVRLALRRLEHEKLVVNEPFRGVFVRQVQPEELNSLFDIREVLEGLAARNVAGEADQSVLDKLATLARNTDEAASKARWVEYFDSDKAFHRELFQHSGNETLIEMIEVYDFHLRTFAFYDRFQGHVIEQLQEHADELSDQHSKLVEILSEGDGPKAEAAFRQHVNYAKTVTNIASQRRENSRR